MEKYVGASQLGQVVRYFGNNLEGTLSWDYLARMRDEWRGPLVLKGILHPEDVEQAASAGVDGIIVSNHGGRQFDGAPATIEMLPQIKAAVGGRVSILYDSGVRNALDIVRALALGADFVFLGRSFIFGVGALGKTGGDHTAEILFDELKNVMTQLGCANLEELSSVECRRDSSA